MLSIEERVIEFFAAETLTDARTITPETPLGDVQDGLKIDSTEMWIIATEIENEFDLEELQDAVLAGFKTVQDVIDYITQHQPNS